MYQHVHAGPPESATGAVSQLARRRSMNEDRMKGSLKETKGTVKENIGKATGDEKLKREGQADQVEGKAQNIAGGIKDTLKDQHKH